MAVYVHTNGGADTTRHLDLWCAAGSDSIPYLGPRKHAAFRGTVPTWRQDDISIAYVSNSTSLKARTQPCPECLFHSGPLPVDLTRDDWRNVAHAGEIGVYDIYDEARRICQIGAADRVDLPGRIASRFRATAKSRCQHADGMWFVYDLLASGGRPKVRTHSPQPGETPSEAEHRIRELRRAEGWQVASTR